MFELKTKQ